MRSAPPVFPNSEPAVVADEFVAPSASAQAVQRGANTADIEARLTDEVRRFGVFFAEAADRLRSIGEDAGDNLDKLVVASQRLLLLQFSDAILQSMRECSSLAEYVDHLGELELSLRDAFREVVLDGRKFACIALTDERAREFFRAHQGGEQSGEVHEKSSRAEDVSVESRILSASEKPPFAQQEIS